jgi:uncharacterized membrane protein YhaH (DUF805 family)
VQNPEDGRVRIGCCENFRCHWVFWMYSVHRILCQGSEWCRVINAVSSRRNTEFTGESMTDIIYLICVFLFGCILISKRGHGKRRNGHMCLHRHVTDILVISIL